MKKKLKKKSNKQDAGKAANPQMALASPADAAAFSAGYAGLGAIGSINEDNKDSDRISEELNDIILKKVK